MKNCLIIGNKNAIVYKEIFKLIKENKIWLGFTSPKGFDQPSTYEVKQMAGLTKWFTNIEHKKHNTPIEILLSTYTRDTQMSTHTMQTTMLSK